ncbi:MAG: hypothetical protein Q7S22_05925 [Candidatus Micrarchaeota archaeon]|nr:hypothetical protein [Candidatus Micrarchaeota archaeon]
MKTDYLELHIAEEAEKKISEELVKTEDASLPEFVKDIPTSVKKSVNRESVSIDYIWEKVSSDSIQLRHIEFSSKETLDSLYRINEKDGTDQFVVRHNAVTYILRKTTKEVAVALCTAFRKIKCSVESIVGYAKTLIGNFYVISKIDQTSWTFDKSLSKGNYLHNIDLVHLDDQHRKSLIDLLVEKTIELHSKNLLIKNFSLNNILFTNNTLLFTDLRNLRLSRKKSLLVEEFKKMLHYLFNLGIVSSVDVYHATAVYCSALEKPSEEWYREKTGKNGDSYKIITAMEKAVLG